jgi:hypothetical protein
MMSKKVTAVVAYGICSGVLCLSSVAIANALQVLPHFPAYGGEEDFNFRFAAFLAGFFPSFIVFGAVVGFRSKSGDWWKALIGMVAGTSIVFALAMFLTNSIEAIQSRSAANAASVVFMSAWALLAFSGAVFAQRLGSSRKD